MTSEQERKNRRTGLIVSSGFHLALLLLFIFLLAWKEPNPPLPEYGIEINFGTSEVGSGDIQPEDVSNQTENQENSQPEEQQPEEETNDTEEIVEESVTEETPEIPEITEDIESPDVIDETEKIKEELVEEPIDDTQNNKEKITEQPVEEEKEDTEGSQNEEAKEDEASTSHGDNIEKEGDKGDEEGTVDARALYGNKGGGGGASYQLAGWLWDFVPKPNDTSSESGKIVFEITIDDQGEIISVKTVERSVSPSVEKLYKDEVRRLTFSKTSENTRPAPVSKGKITFILKAH